MNLAHATTRELLTELETRFDAGKRRRIVDGRSVGTAGERMLAGLAAMRVRKIRDELGAEALEARRSNDGL